MSSTSTKTGLAIALIFTASCARRFRAEGVVLSVHPERGSVVISHRAIPRYMDAMAMEFRVAKPAELKGLAPGSRVDFRLGVGSKRTTIRDIHVRPGGMQDVVLAQPAHKLSTGDMVPNFALTDQHGAVVQLSDLRGSPVAIDFIYTRCPLPDVCPRLSANFALLQKRFGDRITLLSVTIDPSHDTPAVLGAYAKRWQAGSGWHFLTGTAAEVESAAASFGLVYWAEEGVISHTSATAIITSEGRLGALLEGSTFTARQLTDMVRTVCLF